MTLPEYELLMKAVELRRLDDELRVHKQAFLNFSVKATRKSGAPVYSNFRKFFDYEKELARIEKREREGRTISENIAEFFSKKKGG